MNTNNLPVVKTMSDDVDTTRMLLKPIAPVDNIIEAYREYSLLKARLLGENDYQVIRDKKFIKKSGFRKLSSAFGISTEITRENRLNLDGYFVYEITVRAIASNGRYMESCASCGSNERAFVHIEHDTRATAQTRACCRAIADLIGTGEVPAEEMYTTAEQAPSTQSDSPEYHLTDEWGPEDISWFLHKGNRTHSSGEIITVKQKSLLVKLIESKYQDEQTRSGLFQRLPFLTKQEAWSAIKKMLGTPEQSYG